LSEQTAPASPYSVVILTPGPSAGSGVADSGVLAEWLNNFAAPDGRLPALMEVDDNPLISGVAVVPVDAAAAAQVLAADPAVVAGRYAFEVHPADGFPV
jgi:hypothetical protein